MILGFGMLSSECLVHAMISTFSNGLIMSHNFKDYHMEFEANGRTYNYGNFLANGMR
jgi:hypothetical protein